MLFTTAIGVLMAAMVSATAIGKYTIHRLSASADALQIGLPSWPPAKPMATLLRIFLAQYQKCVLSLELHPSAVAIVHRDTSSAEGRLLDADPYARQVSRFGVACTVVLHRELSRVWTFDMGISGFLIDHWWWSWRIELNTIENFNILVSGNLQRWSANLRTRCDRALQHSFIGKYTAITQFGIKKLFTLVCHSFLSSTWPPGWLRELVCCGVPGTSYDFESRSVTEFSLFSILTCSPLGSQIAFSENSLII